jgi:hypothetical protein
MLKNKDFREIIIAHFKSRTMQTTVAIATNRKSIIAQYLDINKVMYNLRAD